MDILKNQLKKTNPLEYKEGRRVEKPLLDFHD
jgi:hypothetical protein